MSELFGRYRLEELIGCGGMGEVYRAVDTTKDRVVAVKRLSAGVAANNEFQARFRREAALAARLDHPHVVPVHDYGEIDGWLYLEMRLVEGMDLASLLAGTAALPPARAVNIATQIATALDAAHGPYRPWPGSGSEPHPTAVSPESSATTLLVDRGDRGNRHDLDRDPPSDRLPRSDRADRHVRRGLHCGNVVGSTGDARRRREQHPELPRLTSCDLLTQEQRIGLGLGSGSVPASSEDGYCVWSIGSGGSTSAVVDVSNAAFFVGSDFVSFTVGGLRAERHLIQDSTGAGTFCVVTIEVESQATVKMLGDYFPPRASESETCAPVVALAEIVAGRVR